MGMAASAIDLHRYGELRGDTETVHRIMEESFDAMELLGPGEQDTVPMKLTIADSFGVKLKAVPAREKFAYELKIPLHADSSSKYAVLASKDSVITIVLESSAPESEEQGHTDHQGAGEGLGRGGQRGQFGGGIGGESFQGGRHDPSEPFTAKLRIKLAGNNREK
jgi:hypothetical protein